MPMSPSFRSCLAVPAAVLLIALALGAGPVAAEADKAPKAAQSDYSPAKPKEGHSYPDCFCTDTDGARVELGETACLRIGSQKHVLARCEMSLNSPMWRRISEFCPSA